MDVAILLFEALTVLDAIGPYDVFKATPGTKVTFVAKHPGIVHTDDGALGLEATHGIADVTETDVLIVPGGFGTEMVVEDEEALEWVRSIHETTTYTTSVCTGSIILGAAGLLTGLPATTHWTAFERLASFGAEPTLERVVHQGKIVTAAGVSSGIDMALEVTAKLHGDDMARAIQLAIEYDPQPPFDAGSPTKAPAEIVELVRAVSTQRREQLRIQFTQ